jgi:bifunctional N-acetylglucosamine-1-phosphate-uridyltransferase/glucosamine-1-phosphate-acetyltransferase GlmU-like protein
MTWSAVVAALEPGDRFRSRVSTYLHPLAGRPIAWHVFRLLTEVAPPPSELRVLHHGSVHLPLPERSALAIHAETVEIGDEARALRAAVTSPGMKVLIDAAAPLIVPATIARLVRAAEDGIALLEDSSEGSMRLAVAGEGPALASADDPRFPRGAVRVPPTVPSELVRVTDRHTLGTAAEVMRDRLVRMHQDRGVTFLLPATCWVDVDVRIGPDTVIYPGCVLEGMTEIGSECVIGPYSRIVESTIGRGVELKGWNYVTRTSVRNHAVMEPHARRGLD